MRTPRRLDTLVAMAPLVCPIVVHADDRRVDVLVQAAEPLPFARIRAALCDAAELAPDSELYHGIGAVEDDWIVGQPPLVAGCVVRTAPVNQVHHQPALILAVVAGPDAGQWVPVATEPIRVGRGPRVDLSLNDPAISAHHACFVPTATGVAVTDLGSTNGVFVDGVQISTNHPAQTGATVRIGGSILQLQLTTEPPGGFVADGLGHLVRRQASRRQVERLPRLPDPPPPAPRKSRRTLPLVSVLVGAVAGGSLALLFGNPMFLAFAAFGPLTMLATGLADRVRGRRSYRQELAAYRTALRDRSTAVDAVVLAERRTAWRTWPGPAELERRANRLSARLWERAPGDTAYLVVSIGPGSRALDNGGSPTSPHQIEVPDVPMNIPLRGVFGAAGPGGRALARWIVTQVACLHSPSDVAVVIVGAQQEFLACLDLPHIPGQVSTSGPRGQRSETHVIIGDLAAVGDRDLLVVVDGTEAIASPIGRALISAAAAASPTVDPVTGTAPDEDPAPGAVSGAVSVAAMSSGSSRRRTQVAVVCLAPTPSGLPATAAPLTAPVPPTTSTAGTTQALNAAPPASIVRTGIAKDRFERTCRALTPLRDGVKTAPLPPPSTVELTAMLGPIDAESLRKRWSRPSTRAVLGAGSHGATVVDLDADGPHLLIAGTTGSGKSELLQTLIAGLAVAGSPQHTTFLLVDYKGGAAFADIAELPHVVGVLTDLDPAGSARALASLRAELKRREEAAAAGAPPPARLVVVIDEFATLATELPEFLSGILDIAQRGRSLGLHLILATQRPAGVVSPAMRANISARICLRVTDAADSVDVIGAPDASRISQANPGRAILTTGGGMQGFQTARVTTSAPAELTVTRRDMSTPATDTTREIGGGSHGGVSRGAVSHCAANHSGDDRTIVDDIVAAAKIAARDMPSPARPWVPPLPDHFCPEEGHSRPEEGHSRPEEGHGDCLGLVDLPQQQCHRQVPLPSTSVLVTGSPGTGRTTVLRRIATIAARRGAEIIVIDGAGGLADLRDCPQVTSYLSLDEPRLILRVLGLLGDRARNPTDGRLRYLVIDHYDVVASAIERLDYLSGSALLTELPSRSGGTVRIAASGPSALVHQRMAVAFPTVIALGSPGGTAVAGRGMWDGSAIQIADCPRGAEQLWSVTSDSTMKPSMEALWPDPIVVRPLPTSVRAKELPMSESNIPLGIGGDAAELVTCDMSQSGGAVLVTGPRRSGVTTALTLIATGAAAAGIPVVWVTTTGTAPVAAPPPMTRIVDIRTGVEPLRSLLAAHAGPLLLVVDHNGQGDEHPAAALLEAFLAVCQPGQHLLLGERIDILARARRGHLRTAIGFRRGLLLAPDASDGGLLDVLVPRKTGPVPVGRGLWVEAGVTTNVQVALPEQT